MMTKHLREPVQSEKLHVAPPIGTQPATFDDSGATNRATTNATTSLKAAAAKVLQGNKVGNTNATCLKKQCNKRGNNEGKKLHAVWQAEIDGYSLTIIDPSWVSEAAMWESLIDRFGYDRLQSLERLTK